MAIQSMQQQSGKEQAEAAPFGRQVLAQTRVELLLTLRRGESVLITLIVPVVLLIYFASLNIIPGSTGKAVDFLLPGMLALASLSRFTAGDQRVHLCWRCWSWRWER